MSKDPDQNDLENLLDAIAKKFLSQAETQPEASSEASSKKEEVANKEEKDKDKSPAAEKKAAAKKLEESHKAVVEKFAPNAKRLVEGLESLALATIAVEPIRNMNRLELTLLFDKALDVSKKILYTIYGQTIGDEVIQASRILDDHDTDMMLKSDSPLMSELISKYNPVDNTEVNDILSNVYREGFTALSEAVRYTKTKILIRQIEHLHHAVNLLLKARCVTLSKLRQ